MRWCLQLENVHWYDPCPHGWCSQAAGKCEFPGGYFINISQWVSVLRWQSTSIQRGHRSQPPLVTLTSSLARLNIRRGSSEACMSVLHSLGSTHLRYNPYTCNDEAVHGKMTACVQFVLCLFMHIFSFLYLYSIILLKRGMCCLKCWHIKTCTQIFLGISYIFTSSANSQYHWGKWCVVCSMQQMLVRVRVVADWVAKFAIFS